MRNERVKFFPSSRQKFLFSMKLFSNNKKNSFLHFQLLIVFKKQFSLLFLSRILSSLEHVFHLNLRTEQFSHKIPNIYKENWKLSAIFNSFAVDWYFLLSRVPLFFAHFPEFFGQVQFWLATLFTFPCTLTKFSLFCRRYF